MASGKAFFPLGEENFASLIKSGACYVDKTLALKDLVTESPKVSLMLRPRRFGKSLTMSMIKNFLEMNYDDPGDITRQEKIFKNLKVFKEQPQFCADHMGRYPVISISFGRVNGTSFKDAFYNIADVLGKVADQFSFFLDREDIPHRSSLFISMMIDYRNVKASMLASDGSVSPEAVNFITSFLSRLMDFLYRIYGIQIVVIIDEYDVPLQKATVGGYYDQMLGVIRGIFSTVLKGNDSLGKAFVTGCLRIAYQSIFTGANNFVCFGLSTAEYSDLIGFTPDEVHKLLDDSGMADRYDEVARWYDGYTIGGRSMLCPWSVLNFLSSAKRGGNDPRTVKPENYWANTSGNDVLGMYLESPRDIDDLKLTNLVNGGTEEIDLQEFTTYPDIRNGIGFDTFATLMLHTGYLTYDRNTSPSQEGKTVVRIPNEEVRQCFTQKVDKLFSKENPVWVSRAVELSSALLAGDASKSREIINDMLLRFISFRDITSNESYYHGFLTGVLGLTTSKGLVIKSNPESGNGFSDIILKKGSTRTAAILEFKKSPGEDPSAWLRSCQEAVKQINEKKYDYHLRNDGGFTTIFKYGIAFWGKNCEILLDESNGQGS